MKIAVKYCGGCNPSIDRANLVGQLAMLLADAHPDWKLVTLGDTEYDAVILVNGCTVGCVQKQFVEETRPVFLIAGESLQRERISERDLPQEVIRKIRNLERNQRKKEERT